jgi:hypothetical protein
VETTTPDGAPALVKLAPQPPPAGGVLGGHEHRAAPLTAHGDPLDHPEQHQTDRRPAADLGIAGQQPDEEAGHPHQRHGQHEHPLAPQQVAEVTEDHAADRSGEVAGGERAEAGDGRHHRVEVGEEDLVEHHRRGGGIEQEVVVLDEAAEVAGCDGAPQLDVVLARLSHGGTLVFGGGNRWV